MSSESVTSAAPKLRVAEIIVIAGFLVANIGVPVIWGDIFPFTSSPMFRDAPRVYCVYRALTPDGKELPLDSLLLQRVYDGNPPGYGVGITPPATLARFGEVASEAEVRAHVAPHLTALTEVPFVMIEQDVIGCVEGRCQVRTTHRFRVERVVP